MNFSKKIIGSLSLRILLVCTLLLIVPLLLNTFVIYRQDYILKMRELLTELKIIGYGRSLLLEEMIALRKENLHLISLVIAEKSSEEQALILTKIKQEESLDSLAICCNAAESSGLSLGIDPQNGNKLLFIEQPIDKCLLQMGLSAQSLIDKLSYLEGSTYPFHLSLLDANGSFFVGDTLDLTTTTIQIFTPDKIKSIPFFSGFMHLKQKASHLGLQIPIKEASFSLLVVIPQEAVADLEKSKILSRLSSLFFLTLILGTAGAIWIIKRMAHPLNALCAVMDQVGKGNLNTRFKQDLMGFEINILGNNFNHMIDSLLKHMEEAKNERIARMLLENELNIAKEIQLSMLPKTMPFIEGLDIAALLQPAKEVAGDFYDLIFKKEQNCLLLAVVDAAGKGISACLYSLSVRGMLRSCAATSSHLSEVIQLTNQLFCQDSGDTGAFVTAWIGSINLTTLELEYGSCGHPPALLKRQNGSIEELTTPNIALGVIPFEKVFTSKIQLSSGDLLLLYTDGLIESHNQKMQLLGKHHLIEVVSIADDISAQEMIDYLMNKAALFEKGAPQFDDLTLLVIRIC